MPRLTFSPKPATVAKAVAKFGDDIVIQIQTEMAKAAANVIDEMSEPGVEPPYPIHWTSMKQARAFFKSKGFGGGIPHKRTDRHAQGWQMDTQGNGIVMYNNVRGSKFLYGDARSTAQQPMYHTFWPSFREVVDYHRKQIPDRINTLLRKLAKKLSDDTKAETGAKK